MPALAPPSVLVEVTAIPVPTLTLAKVPVPLNVTTSGDIIPLSVPVMVAAFVPLYTLLLAAALAIVRALVVMSAVNPVGWVRL